jgi:hypothetical protein
MRARTLGFSLWAVAIWLVLCAHALAFVSRPEASLYVYWIEATLIVPTFATLDVCCRVQAHNSLM